MFLITTNTYKNIYKSSFAIESNITGIIINLLRTLFISFFVIFVNLNC